MDRLKPGLNKPAIFILALIFFSSCVSPAAYAGYSLVPQFLCEQGIRFYNQGDFARALSEFNKALMASPGYTLALEYIERIRQRLQLPAQEMPVAIKDIERIEAISRAMERIEREQRAIAPVAVPPKITYPKELIPLQILVLDESLEAVLQPIEIEINKSLIIAGRNIQRFLVTPADILTVEKKSRDELLVSANDFGYTYLHIWDESKRWTLEFLGAPPRPEEPTYEELMRLAEDRARSFRLRYYLNWSSFETGRRIDQLSRTTYAFRHNLSLDGETPYGNLGSVLSVRSLQTTTDLTYLSLWLKDGRYGRFEDFTLRAFDYSPGFGNLAFGGASLRGLMVESPVFEKKIDYRLFWGRQAAGRYGGLSPGLAESRHSFLSGIDMNWHPSKSQHYGFSVIHGWGRDRESYLNDYAYDLDMNWNFDRFKFGYEMGFDSETFAHLVDFNFSVPKLFFNAQLRDISNDYKNILGYGWQRGQLGGRFNLSLVPTEKLSTSCLLHLFKDRLYPAEDNPSRWNQDFYWDVNYALDSLTNLRADFRVDNQLGRISRYRFYDQGISLHRAFELIRTVNTFVTYRHQEGKYFDSPMSDYINDRIYLGLRLRLIGDVYYYANKELNWLQERFYATRAQPRAMETGLDWSGRILNSPFYGNLRCSYRDEEDTISNLGFLSGEDYLEGYAELSYRPNPDKELYCSTRVRNVWADNPNVNKRVEVSFNAGMRYMWDTGARWDAVGIIEGYVFKDLNSDALRQADEPPLEGVKVWLGKDRWQVSDILGYYKFTNVKARKAYVSVDLASVPQGFVLTVPIRHEAAIGHRQTTRINFGVASHTEIRGVVFEDKDGDGKQGPQEPGVRGVVLILEDATKAVTDDAGRYSFRRFFPGKHTITLDLNTLPREYIPAVPIFKDVEVLEGAIYNYNIPLRKTE